MLSVDHVIGCLHTKDIIEKPSMNREKSSRLLGVNRTGVLVCVSVYQCVSVCITLTQRLRGDAHKATAVELLIHDVDHLSRWLVLVNGRVPIKAPVGGGLVLMGHRHQSIGDPLATIIDLSMLKFTGKCLSSALASATP